MKLWKKMIIRIAEEWPSIRNKLIKFLLFAAALGILDSTHPTSYIDFDAASKFLSTTLPSWINLYVPLFTSDTLYQTILMSVSAGLTFLALYDSKFSWPRRSLAAIMIIPGAVVMDYVSAAITAGRMFVLPLPKIDYTWRPGVYHNTAFSGIANVVNEPSRLLSGAIFGYDIAIYLAIGFIAVNLAIMAYKIKNTSK